MAVKRAITIAALTLLAGCASVASSGRSQNANSTKLDDRLTPRNLNNGECGIFVWTADNAKRFIFFSQADKPTASWWSKDGEIEISRRASDSISAFDQLPAQNFDIPSGGALKVALFDPEDVDNGTRYKSGAITQTTVDGWEKVIPVIGMSACNLKVVGSEYSLRSTRSKFRLPGTARME